MEGCTLAIAVCRATSFPSFQRSSSGLRAMSSTARNFSGASEALTPSRGVG